MQYKTNESEYRFLCILWEIEPIRSPDLVKICLDKFGWKKSTTYTVIKNLMHKKIVKNINTIVTTLVPKEQIVKQETELFLRKTFNGNIPDLLTTFLKDRKISVEEAEKLKKIIEEATN